MKLKIYNTKSSNNTINKVLTDEVEYDVVFKDTIDFLNPTIRLKDKVAYLEQTYAYLPDLGRYYYINRKESQPSGIYILYLQEDVLMTYKNDILGSMATVSRSKDSNMYYDGGDYRSEEKKEHKLYNSDKQIQFEQSTILVTIGG